MITTKKVHMTFEEYDNLMENLSDIKLPEIIVKIPEIKDINTYLSACQKGELKRMVIFLSWLLEQELAETEEERTRMKAIKQFVNEHLVLYDKCEDVEIANFIAEIKK